MIHIVARAEMPRRKENILRTAAVLIALAASALCFFLMRYNPLEIFAQVFVGSLGSAYRITMTAHKAIPLAVLSLGTAIAFRMKFWNIGQEGQFYMGAFGAACVAFAFPRLPAAVLLPLMFVASLAAGGLWAFIPAILKAKLRTNETLVTLMLNYVAIQWISYLQYGPWKDPAGSGFPKIANFPPGAVLPSLFGIHIGWLITILLTFAVYVLFNRTKLGYEIEILGESEATARYAGMNITRIILVAMLLSGGFCGAAGMMQASAVERSLSDTISGGLGFTAVITTWLARLNPFGILIVSVLFSILLQGGVFLQSSMQIPAAISQILQGIIIFFVLGSDFFTRYQFIRSSK